MTKRAGFIQLKINGVLMDAYGDFEVGYGQTKRSGLTGADGRHLGTKEEAQIPYIEGKIMDRSNFDVLAYLNAEDATVTYRKANGKTVVLQKAYYAGEGKETSANAEIDFRMEGERMEET